MLTSKIRSPHVRMEVSQITEDIFVGTNECCQIHYQILLLNQGITHDVSLQGEMVDAPYGAESFLWLPTEDHLAPSTTSLEVGVAHIDRVIANGGKVYVHCKNGHGRAPTLVAAWLVAHGRTAEQAVSLVKAKRPEIHLEQAQLDALRVFAKRASGAKNI